VAGELASDPVLRIGEVMDRRSGRRPVRVPEQFATHRPGGSTTMTDTNRSRERGAGVSFNMNEATGLYGHWQQIDELQEQYSHFWTTFAYGYWVLTEPEAIREAFNGATCSRAPRRWRRSPTRSTPSSRPTSTRRDVKYRHI